jgi:hypothetical protein
MDAKRGIPASASNRIPAMQASIIINKQTNKQNTALIKLENRMDSSKDDLAVRDISLKYIVTC